LSGCWTRAKPAIARQTARVSALGRMPSGQCQLKAAFIDHPSALRLLLRASSMACLGRGPAKCHWGVREVTEIETDGRYLCRDGYVRRVGRSWGDGTLTWVLDPAPAVPLTLDGMAAGTCTTKAFVEMVSVAISEP